MAGLRGDGWNLGFVVETERQVEAHLDEHLQTLPGADLRSRAILTTMKADEARHADNAEQAGARILPQPIPTIMAAPSRLMKTVASPLLTTAPPVGAAAAATTPASHSFKPATPALAPPPPHRASPCSPGLPGTPPRPTGRKRGRAVKRD